MSVSILLDPEAKNNQQLALNCYSINANSFNIDTVTSTNLNVTGNTTTNTLNVVGAAVLDTVSAPSIGCDTLIQTEGFAQYSDPVGTPMALAVQTTYYPIQGAPQTVFPNNSLFEYNNLGINPSEYVIFNSGFYIIETYASGFTTNGTGFSYSIQTNGIQPVGASDARSVVYGLGVGEGFAFYSRDITTVLAGTTVNGAIACETAAAANITITKWYMRLTKIG